MGKTTVEITRLSRDVNAAQADEDARVHRFVIDALRLLKQVTGILLGSLAVSAQVGNVLICLSVMFMGPAFIIGLLCR